MNAGLAERQQTLIRTNVAWLTQALELLERTTEEQFTASPQGLEPHRVAGHVRHILEFYQCFFEGLRSSHIDYDARRRDAAVERSTLAAASHLRDLIASFESTEELRGDMLLWVRMEDAPVCGDPWTTSSVSREWQVLSSHTIHHFALIAMTLRAHGAAVDPDFGMAPSTLRHREKKQAA